MRLQLITDTFLPHAGGSRFYYYNLLRRVAESGDDVLILTSKVKGWEAFDAREQTSHLKIERRFTPLRDHSYTQLPKIFGPMVKAFARAIWKRPDVVHCGDLYPAGVIGVVLKKALNIPFVAYCHGEDITLTDQRRFQPKLRDLIYRNANAIVANGAFAMENLERTGIDSGKVFKITPGLDRDVFFPDAGGAALRERYGLGDDEIIVMTVARLVQRKGHARVLRALASLRMELPAFRYVIVGRGPMEAELRELASTLKIEDRLIFAGFVADEDLNVHYNMADVVAMPNTDEAGDVEGFGMVFLEANAAGKPVMGGRSGGTAEAVLDGVTGFLVGGEDESELREALRKLMLDDELRERMGQSGWKRAHEEFDWASRAATLRRINADIMKLRI